MQNIVIFHKTRSKVWNTHWSSVMLPETHCLSYHDYPPLRFPQAQIGLFQVLITFKVSFGNFTSRLMLPYNTAIGNCPKHCMLPIRCSSSASEWVNKRSQTPENLQLSYYFNIMYKWLYSGVIIMWINQFWDSKSATIISKLTSNVPPPPQVELGSNFPSSAAKYRSVCFNRNPF